MHAKVCKAEQILQSKSLKLAAAEIQKMKEDDQSSDDNSKKHASKRERKFFLSHQLQKQAKNMLRFQLTPDCEVPLETKKTNQVLLKVTKMRNTRTGKIAYRIHKVKQLDYEFECEALTDFAFEKQAQDQAMD